MRLALLLLALPVWLVPTLADASRAQLVAAGRSHTCAVTNAGGVKCWGDNYFGQLGDGGTTGRLSPANVSGLAGVVALAAGDSHTCALTTGGGVKCWGANWYGQLGDGTTMPHGVPADVSGLRGSVTAITAGDHHTCAVVSGGGLKCWGNNGSGQVGDGTTTDRFVPADVSGLSTGVAAVTAGGQGHTCALTSGGGVRCWGRNADGELGDGTTTQRPTPVSVSGLASSGAVSVAAGREHSCAVTSAGGVLCWGENFYSRLGDGTSTQRLTPVSVSGLTTGVAAVSAGYLHTCAVMAAGGVKCWGAEGMVGDGTDTRRPTPADVVGLPQPIVALSAGSSHTCAVTRAGGVRCWGANRDGEIGDGTRTLRTSPVDVPGIGDTVLVSGAGSFHTCVITAAGGVRCWGGNFYGQLGDGTTTPRPTPGDVTGLTSGVVALAVGNYHTCAAIAAGGVKCWGANWYGQLGDGTNTGRTTPTDVSNLGTIPVASLSASESHTCAVTTAGAVKCWGLNSDGQLGDGTTTNRPRATDVSGLATGVASVAAGDVHTCAVTTGGALRCWGSNAYGQLGDGTTTNRLIPTPVPGLTNGVTAAAAGYVHSCALASGGVSCWGTGSSGQLGDGTLNMRTTPGPVPGLSSGVLAVTAASLHTCAVTAGGGLKCWGNNGSGELGNGEIGSAGTPTDVVGLPLGVASVATRTYHTCAVTTGGYLKCWGDNASGQLGDPVWVPRLAPARTQGFGQFDFDRDDRVDVAVYRPSTGTWFALKSSTSNQEMDYRGWGLQAQGDVPALGDFDGDGIADPAVFRAPTGTWFILESHAGYTTWNWFGWGTATDTLVPGDYDGDGKTDGAVFRSSTGTWYIRPSSGAPAWNVVFGQAGDEPIDGDFDGDGKRDPAVYRAASGTWFWLKSSSNFTAWDYRGWGAQAQGDRAAAGDYDGDGKTDLCVFRPATGTWFILESHAAWTTWNWFGWGSAGDTLAPADYDGDGKADGAVYRPSTGQWFVRPSGGASPWNVTFGAAGDVPLK